MIATARAWWRLARWRGARGRLFCSLCGWDGPSLLRGADGREQHCPRCKSANRHRLIAWLLETGAPPGLRPGTKVLHVAPEAMLAAQLRGRAGRYVTCDLMRRDVDHRIDLQTEVLGEAAFDAVVINHVLEHVPDDTSVLRNLRRMVRPGGTVLVTVPLRADGGPTDEDPAVVSPEARQARFGQRDHVRLYGLDLAGRMEAAGFAVTTVRSEAADPARVAREAMGGEVIFLGQAV